MFHINILTKVFFFNIKNKISNYTNKFLSPLLFYSGLYRIKWNKVSSEKGIIIVLCYHRIVKDRDEQKGLFNIEKGLLVSEFEKQMQFMLNFFQPIHASQAHKMSQPGGMYFAVTFDDGYSDNLELAAPILKNLGIPCTFFVVSDYVGTKKLFWWELLGEMLRKTNVTQLILPAINEQTEQVFSLETFTDKEIAHEALSRKLFICSQVEVDTVIELLRSLLNVKGVTFSREYPLLDWDVLKHVSPKEIEIGGHTASHCNLNKANHLEFITEIKNSIEVTENKLSKKISVFAYPYGAEEHFNSGVINFVKTTQCETAYTVCRGSVSKKTDPFCLPRVFLNNKYAFIWAYNIEMALREEEYN